MTDERSSITLRAKEGAPLADDRLRETVVSTARAIAERTGVRLVSIEATDNQVSVELVTSEIGAVGFAAELRRLTEAWYMGKHDGATLWGRVEEPPA